MMRPTEPDTATNRREQWFVTTSWTVVLTARQDDSAQAEAALETLCRAYWYPLYAFVRRQGYDLHQAQDLTQEFFARLLTKRYLDSVEREKGKFRSFLLAAMRHFLSNEWDRANAAKRGGGKQWISLDETTAEGRYQVEPASTLTPEQEFERLWAVAVLDQAYAKVQAEYAASGKGRMFEQLKAFLANGAGSGDYAAPAAELGMSANTVAVAVRRMRQRYRDLVRAEIANTVASPEEIDEEMRYLLTVLAR
ncbi:MAG TPA: sigma factor [Verrucomicrobiae bacterium]|nr:sigma factor [Verrucomicrobiae bacterium]